MPSDKFKCIKILGKSGNMDIKTGVDKNIKEDKLFVVKGGWHIDDLYGSDGAGTDLI